MIEWINSENPADRELARLTSAGHDVGANAPYLSDTVWDLVVLGGGTAGLVGAIGAAGMGARVLLVESHRLGGDCLHSGCVPSKAILEAAGRLTALGPDEDASKRFQKIFETMRAVRAELATHDSQERLERCGVKVVFGKARFLSPDRLTLGSQELRFKRALIATGSRPRLPDIEGADLPLVVTTHRIFDLASMPRHLTILGGGPVGCELAQGFARLGAKVVLVQSQERLLPRDDAEASALLAEGLRSEGIELIFGSIVRRIDQKSERLQLDFGPARAPIATDLVLVATGRQANIEDLDLAKAGVGHDERGIVTDEYLRTTSARIFAAGDVTGRWQFTHASDAMARLFLRNGLIGFPFTRKRIQDLAIPWITWTWPRVGGIGMDEDQARVAGADTYRVDGKTVDRLRLGGQTQGFFKIFATSKGNILGARACGAQIEGWLGMVTQAMEQGTPLGALADAIHPYPGHAEALKKAAGEFRKKGFTSMMQKIIKWWLSVRS